MLFFGLCSGEFISPSSLAFRVYRVQHLREYFPARRAEKELAELLTLLVEDFEDRHYQLPRAKPLEVLHFLMDQHSLLQKDLADVFGTPSIVSEVLSGKRDFCAPHASSGRELNKDHIQRLSRNFHVSPEPFF